MREPYTILVTGGAGYVGSILIPKLLNKGYYVKVLDLYLYGSDVLDAIKDHPNLEQIQGDIRNPSLLEKILPNTDSVIHLACISNDPSFELNPLLGKSINYDAFFDLVRISKNSKVKRFIYASSSSVYGIKEEENVTEDLPLEPLTDYSKYKALCEGILLKEQSPDFTTVVIRPATVCGYSPRLRLDLIVNILTNQAFNTGRIKVTGGQQKRPNIHIEDMTDLYVRILELPDERIAGEIFNAGYDNYRVSEIAEIVKNVVDEEIEKEVEIVTVPTNDLRSYQISSEKIKRELGFQPTHSIEDGVRDLCLAFKTGKIPNPMDNIQYYNVKTMLAKNLQ
ncbi:NAD-dependent epimerase/dehydratase family protein [Chloroflexota bacterium]